jgi:hypothetical protein
MKPIKAHKWVEEKDGWYVEPEWVSRRLFEVEKFNGVICDPACGWGRILHEARAAGYTTVGGDIVDRGRHELDTLFRRRDYLSWHRPFAGGVVCNPPFDHVEEFCRHALDHGADKVAVICLTRRLNAAHWLEDLPLRRVWLLTPRPSMPPGAWIMAGNKPGGGTQEFCWLIFESGYAGRPEINWLHRGTGK